MWIDSGAVVASTSSAWRCDFTEEDTLIIPELHFNIRKSWQEFAGQKFTAPDGPHTLVGMEQRTAFVLNRTGALIESETSAVSDSIAPIEDKPRPKRLIFRGPFFIYAIKNGVSFPYFAMKVETPELMVPLNAEEEKQ